MSLHFNSRRSPVLSLHGCVASSNPLASEAGLTTLKAGGNAADAAVAVAAALNVTEPFSTGLGGDCFCLFYSAKDNKVHGLNGSGRSPARLSLDVVSSEGFCLGTPIPFLHALNVTVPGAAAGWVDTVETFGSGKLSLSTILNPAIELAECGFPVGPVASHHWDRCLDQLVRPGNSHCKDLLYQGERAPVTGEIMQTPHLANTLKVLASEGKAGFYQGRIAQAIVDIVQSNGGVLSKEDLSLHCSTFDEPIKTTYKGVDIWEMPPNGQGLTALLALNILNKLDVGDVAYGSATYWHLIIEALRLSFADTQWYIADPDSSSCPVEQLLGDKYTEQRSKLISLQRALKHYGKGSPSQSSDTVYFTVGDDEGNACSFINSNYMGFGTGLVPEGCGFTLHNRGANFSLDPLHPNVLAPGKRPYHTIIPGMATHTSSGDLFASFGVMGGFMQPQGHVQVMLNMIDFGMDPQSALDAPRICVGAGHFGSDGPISVEEGVPNEVIDELKKMGHDIRGPVIGHDRALFGRGQIIRSCPQACSDARGQMKGLCNVWWSGSDGRADGMAIGY